MIIMYPEILEKAVAMYKQGQSNQFNLFDILGEDNKKIDVKYPDLPEYSLKEKLGFEKTVAGVYITGHPLEQFYSVLNKLPNTTQDFIVNEDEEGIEVEEEHTSSKVEDGASVKIGGIVTSVKKIMTKKGSYMAIINLEDMYGEVECVMFSRAYERYFSLVEVDAVITVNGKLQVRDGRAPSILVDSLVVLNDHQTLADKVQKKEYLGLIISEENESALQEIIEILSFYPGTVRVVFKIKGKNRVSEYYVRNCRGLVNELCSILDENEIKFFEV